MLINEGFVPKRKADDRLPPGQYEERDFPVLSLGPTPKIDIAHWKLEITGLVRQPLVFTWEEFNRLPMIEWTKDIHCVTKWSKLDTRWRGVPFDELMRLAGVSGGATHLVAHSYDDYTTNLPVADITGGQAMVAVAYENGPIHAEHGGPARIVLPHLYFWKSAKWLRKLEFIDHDEPGFWEVRGYHNYGDPWKEQRYTND
jgi:DMSO/TMAO reductase YedYZ molybdopterin-dependent catalytic subunit